MNRYGMCRTFVLLMMLLAAHQADAQWAQFRGPNGSGVGADTGYPAEFSPSKNVVWKTAVPDAPSSPVVIGGRVFLTASQGDPLLTIALDAKTGREAWRRQIPRARTHKIYNSNHPASPTPVADEAGVVAFFPDFGLVAYANDGKEAGRHPLGPFRNFYGMGASPIIVRDAVVLVCDQAAGSFLLALERASGRVRWKTERTGRTVGWATPMVFRPAGDPPNSSCWGRRTWTATTWPAASRSGGCGWPRRAASARRSPAARAC